jgi:hypothetical protein
VLVPLKITQFDLTFEPEQPEVVVAKAVVVVFAKQCCLAA